MSDSPKIISPWGKGSMRALREISKANTPQQVSKTSEISNEISNEPTITLDLLDDNLSQPTNNTPTSETANHTAKETTNKIALNTSHEISKKPTNELLSKISNETTSETSNNTSIKPTNDPSNKPSNNTSFKPSSKTTKEISNKIINKTASELSSEPSQELLKKRYVLLDSTHTSAEQKIYSVMYRETISKGINGRRFPVAELMELTGINSNTTVSCRKLSDSTNA